MRIRKLTRPLLIFFLSIAGILILLFATLNLPFSQRFATRKVNQVLSQVHVPIHLDAIRRILPGSALIQGVSITDLNGDTMIYAGEIEADIRLLALIRKKVILQEVNLEHANVNLLMNNASEQLHIAEAFASGKDPDKKKNKEGKGDWTIRIHQGKLAKIHFQMKYPQAGLHILQEIDRVEIKDFSLPIAERELRADVLDLEGVSGNVTLQTHESKPLSKAATPGNKEALPWNFGLLHLSMKNIDFTFDQGKEALCLHLILEQAEIKAKEMDFQQRVLDLKDFTLTKANVAVLTPKKRGDSQSGKVESGKFDWLLKGRNIDFEDLGLSIGERNIAGDDSLKSIFSMAGLEMKMKGFVMDADHANASLKRLSFDLDNGFSMKKLEGELESDRVLTNLKLDMETEYSQASLKGQAHSGLLNIISDPGSIHKAQFVLSKTGISLLDLFPFILPGTVNPDLANLSSAPISISGQVDLLGSVLDISGFSISQEHYFQMSLDGKLVQPFPVSNASCNLDLGLSEVDAVWLNELFHALGMKGDVPGIPGLSIAGQISNSIFSPDVSLELKSQVGNLSTTGSLDFISDSFAVASYMDNVNLGAILENPELGLFSGSARLWAIRDSSAYLRSNISIQLDSLGYKDYKYQDIKLEGRSLAGVYDFHLLSNDVHALADLRIQAIPGDSLFQLNTDGDLSVQLDQLQFSDDTLAFQTHLEAHIIRGPESFESDISLLGTVLENAHRKVDIEQIGASISTDSAYTTISSMGDFFKLDMQVARTIYEFDSMGQAYRNYLATFRDADPETATARVMELPEINASGQISNHDVLNIILKDTGVHIGHLDLTMLHESEENKINYGLKGNDIRYKISDIKTVNAEIVDSAGLLNVRMDFDDASLFSGPANDWLLKANFTDWQGTTSLTVKDPEDRLKYEFEIAASLDSSVLVLEVPAERFIINGKEWAMETSGLLSVDLINSEFSPSLRMYTDSSFLHILSSTSGNLPIYTLKMNQVEMESLVREDLFPGRPDASISGSLGLNILSDSARIVKSDLHFSNVEYSDLHFDQISLSGELEFDDSGSFVVDMQASLDSARASFKGRRAKGGERVIQSEIARIPLNTLQPFTGNTLSELSGFITGKFDASNEGGEEHVNGQLRFNDVQLKIDALNSSFKIPDQNLVLAEDKLIFDRFRVLDTLNNELLVDGFLDFQTLDQVATELEISSSRIQVMSSGQVDDKAPFYGDVYVDSRFSVNGPLVNPTIRGNIRLARGTEVFYRHMDDLSLSESEQIVNFVNYAEPEDQSAPPVIGSQGKFIKSSVETTVEIDPTTRFNVGLSKNIYELDLQITGGGSLMYNMLNNSQMSLSGRYEISEGSAELKLVGWPDKSFRISEGGFIRWDGRVDEPELNFQALNRVRSSYLNPVDGKQRPVDFDVILQLSGYLSDLDVLFTVNTSDQYLMSTINALGPEEQMRQAISILLFEAIDLPGISSTSNYMSQQVNQILASQLNQLTASTFKGVDISFGIDTYNSSSPGSRGQSNTSLSYEVRKSLMNDRAQIEVSGRMRDANQQPGASDLSLSNIAFEYSLDSAGTKFLKVYNEHTYEDVFEGEVIKTGVGVTLRKRHRRLSDIWKREKKKKKERKTK